MEEMEAHWTGKIAQKAIIEKDGKLLLQRHPLHTEWDLPGGRLHAGESPDEGLQREVREELGVDVVLGDVVAIYPRSMGEEGEYMFIVRTATLKNPEQEFEYQKEEVEETKWVTPKEALDVPTWAGVRQALEVFFNTQ
jgi:8-oxo-dGTP diphosphatase